MHYEIIRGSRKQQQLHITFQTFSVYCHQLVPLGYIWYRYGSVFSVLKPFYLPSSHCAAAVGILLYFRKLQDVWIVSRIVFKCLYCFQNCISWYMLLGASRRWRVLVLRHISLFSENFVHEYNVLWSYLPLALMPSSSRSSPVANPSPMYVSLLPFKIPLSAKSN